MSLSVEGEEALLLIFYLYRLLRIGISEGGGTRLRRGGQGGE